MNGFDSLKTVVLASALLAMTTSTPGQVGKQNPVVVIETSMGDMTIELFSDKAPKSVENFVEYAQSGFYDGTIFHRVIKGYLIQGGGFTADMKPKPARAPIPNEGNNGLKNTRGTVAMAKTVASGWDFYRNSATSQFFINAANNRSLDYKGPENFGHAVFGTVVDGMDVVDRIGRVRTASREGLTDVPITPVVIRAVRVKR